MSWVDIVICLVLAISMIVGVVRGFTREVLSLAIWVIALWMAWGLGPQAAVYLGRWINSATVSLYAGYATVFLVVLVVGAAAVAVLVKLVRSSPLASTDRTLGAAIGLLRGLMLVVAGIMVAGINGDQTSVWWQHSLIIPSLAPVADSLDRVVPTDWLKPLSEKKVRSSPASHMGN